MKSIQLDLRSLAIARIFGGLTLLLYFVGRMRDATMFYSDDGILPSWLLLRDHALDWEFTFLILNGTPFFAHLVFVAGILASLMFFLGYKTRIASIVSWLVICTLHARNPLITHGGDDLMRLFMFISVFLPMGACFALDSMEPESADQSPLTTSNPFGMLLLVQIVCVYIFTAIFKIHPDWTSEFTAGYYSLQSDKMTTSIGAWVSTWPMLVLKFFTFSTFVLEFLGPIVLVVFWRVWWLRTLVVASFIGLHLSLTAMFELGVFSYACTTFWLALIPSGFWERVSFSQHLLSALGSSFEKLREGANYFVHKGFLLTPDVAKMPANISFKTSKKGFALSACLIGIILAWNLKTLDDLDFEFPKPLKAVTQVLQLNQRWSMFAPTPSKDDGWFIAEAFLASGQKIDLFAPDQKLSWEKPANPLKHYPSSEWIDMLFYIKGKGYRDYPYYLSRELCEKWNDAGDQLYVTSINLYFMSEPTKFLPDSMEGAEIKKELLSSYECKQTAPSHVSQIPGQPKNS